MLGRHALVAAPLGKHLLVEHLEGRLCQAHTRSAKMIQELVNDINRFSETPVIRNVDMLGMVNSPVYFELARTFD